MRIDALSNDSSALLREEANLSSALMSYLARNDQTSLAASTEIATLLDPLVRQVAAAVSRHGHPTDRQEFIEEALVDVLVPRQRSGPRIFRFDPAKGSLTSWLYTTLGNVWRSRQRASKRTTVPLQEQDGIAAAPPIDWEQLGELLSTPFSPDDEERICRWSPRDRVELMAMSGLYVKLTDKMWEEFLHEYETAMGRRLPRPVPPDAVVEADNTAQRTRPLAEALGYSTPNALSVRWNRCRHLLRALTFARRLYETSA